MVDLKHRCLANSRCSANTSFFPLELPQELPLRALSNEFEEICLKVLPASKLCPGQEERPKEAVLDTVFSPSLGLFGLSL